MIVCSVEPHAEQRSGNRISGHVVVPGGNQPGQVKLDYVVARSAPGIDAVQPHRPVETPCSRPACAENLSQRVSVQCLIPTPFVVYFWGLKQPDFAGAAGLTEIIRFPLKPSKAPRCPGRHVRVSPIVSREHPYDLLAILCCICERHLPDCRPRLGRTAFLDVSSLNFGGALTGAAVFLA